MIYALFAGHRYYPEGGASDFRGFGSIESLKELFDKNIDIWTSKTSYTGTHWGEIAEKETLEIVLSKIDDEEWEVEER